MACGGIFAPMNTQTAILAALRKVDGRTDFCRRHSIPLRSVQNILPTEPGVCAVKPRRATLLMLEAALIADGRLKPAPEKAARKVPRK